MVCGPCRLPCLAVAYFDLHSWFDPVASSPYVMRLSRRGCFSARRVARPSLEAPCLCRTCLGGVPRVLPARLAWGLCRRSVAVLVAALLCGIWPHAPSALVFLVGTSALLCIFALLVAVAMRLQQRFGVVAIY